MDMLRGPKISGGCGRACITCVPRWGVVCIGGGGGVRRKQLKPMEVGEACGLWKERRQDTSGF